MRLTPLLRTVTALLVISNVNLLYADSPYEIDPNNPSQTRGMVRKKIEEICRKLNDPRLNTNEKRIEVAKDIAASFPYRPDKVHIYSRRIKGVVLEAKIVIPFLYKMEVKDEPFQPGGIGVPIKEKAVYLYIIQVNYDAPADGNFDCGPGASHSKGSRSPPLSRIIDAAFAGLDTGNLKPVETAPFPHIPRIRAHIQNIRP